MLCKILAVFSSAALAVCTALSPICLQNAIDTDTAVDRESSLQIERGLLERDDVTLISIEHKLLPELLPYYDAVLELKDGTLRQMGG